MATRAAGSSRLCLKNALPLKVGVCIMATKALGVLAHVAALGARLRRWDQAGKHALVATNGSL